MSAFSGYAGSHLHACHVGDVPLNSHRHPRPQSWPPLAPGCQSHLKRLPSPLDPGSEGTSEADPKTCDRVRPARLRGLWLAGFPGSRKSPFACCFLERTRGHSDALCQGSLAVGRVLRCPLPIPGPQFYSVQCQAGEGWQALWVPEVRGGRARGQSRWVRGGRGVRRPVA